ncbi:MAG: CRISPR-associated endonuclease Cas2 [Planctomycetes bacterium]|jgi:CRISPR-associated protein Cas2|nr:CRISPR-associated endonuclease Cas2 [Planctomycetota bacterium]MBT5119760.1 CRISPR-associated endonuclease Cas2 [Planctomycetota bacterium]MBT7011792.1 CRISPR-associated endonuclease Cas2 [Planctomycetota bacterium]
MRDIYLVSYDIADKKRLRKVYKKMRGYGDALQYSVFWCELSSLEREKLLTELLKLINNKEDRVMMAKLGPIEGKAKEAVQFFGAPLERPGVVPVVV